MALRPKLEFYRLRLVSKDLEYRTFRDFAIQELYQRKLSLIQFLYCEIAKGSILQIFRNQS